MNLKPVSFTHLDDSIKLQKWRPLSYLLLASIAITLFALDANRYSHSQIDMFISLNQVLQIIPSDLWNNLTYLGDVLILIPILSCICIYNPQAWAALFAAIPAACGLSSIGKTFFSIPRPAAVIDQGLFTIIGDPLTANTSLPSGHTITIMTAVFAIIYVSLKTTKKTTANQALMITLFVFGVLVSISRIAVGAHWPLDLLLGSIFGYLAGLSGAYLSHKYKHCWFWMTTKPCYLAAFIFVFPAIISTLIFNNELEPLIIVWVAIVTSTITGLCIALAALKS